MKKKNKSASPEPMRHPRPPLSKGRLWLFRLAAIALPVGLLALAEVTLRLGGYGYPTSFLRKATINGESCWVNNDTFSFRFFPPELARWPGTLRFPVEKAPGTTRIFVFGESAAMGDPQPAYGATRFLEVLLRERFPDKKFEVINVAFTAINSHVILPIARECAKRDGDLWIVYMGNNEMVGPFGAATVFGSQAPPLGMVRLNLTIQQTRLGQLAMATLRRLAGKPANTSWGGMQMFLSNQIPPNDSRRGTVYQNFETNLRDLLNAGTASGARVILNTMSVNLRDCPPFASLANSNLPASDRQAFERQFQAGITAQKNGDWAAAEQNFASASKLDDKFAELQFRWADTLSRMSNAQAGAHFQLACDTDALPFRADSHINGIIRKLASESSSDKIFLSDAEAVLAAAAPAGIAGAESFFEHVHFSFSGNYLLARLWAEQVANLTTAVPQNASNSKWATQEVCERELGLTLWNRSFVLDSVVRRLQQPPLNSQLNNAERLAGFQSEVAKLRQLQANTNLVLRNGQDLVDAIQRHPKDPFLYEGFANFLEAVGDAKQAIGAYRKLHELLPHDFYCNLQLGRLLGEQGQPAEGELLLRQAVAQRPGIPDGWSELGTVCMMQNKYAAALEYFERGRKLRPQDPGYIGFVATALARLNRRSEAEAEFRRVLQLRPDSWEAHFELGGILATDGKIAEAVEAYTQAIRLNPRHKTSRVNYGVVLVRQNRLDEAIHQFEEALRLDPNYAEAQDYLRQVSARRSQHR